MLTDVLSSVGARGSRATCIIGFSLLLAGVLPGCGGTTPEEPLGSDQDAIINGALDTTHQAVVAVLGNNSLCTGTIIHVDAAQSIGHVLTAAHCGSPVEIHQGNDYLNPTAVYSVIDWQNHPGYDAQAQLLDFKMVRFVGASSATPLIPAMAPAEDNLGSGTSVRHLGYGKSGPPPGSDNNTKRRQILGTLSGVNSTHIFYNQPNGGPCNGDSGGPQLTTGTERVAGVTSYGDGDCAVQGTSGRVSGVYDSFIVPYINDAPVGPLSCDQCTQAATSGQGACVPQVNSCFNNNDCNALLSCFDACGSNNPCAQGCINDHPTGWGLYEQIFSCVCDTGCTQECADEAFCNGATTTTATSVASSSATSSSDATGATSGSGAGGSGGANGNGWVAGDAEDRDYDGYAFSSCASAGAGRRSGSGSGSGWFALVGLAGVALLLGRRRG